MRKLLQVRMLEASVRLFAACASWCSQLRWLPLVLSLWACAASWAAQPLSISADNKSRLIGQTNPPLTATYSGFVNGDTVSNLDVAVTLFTTATSNSPAGTYAIEASGAADADYSITHFNGVLTITNPVPTGFGTHLFTNTTPIVIPDSGAAAP